MHCESTDRHGLFMRLPLRIAFRNTLQRSMSVMNFRVVIEEKNFGDCH